MTTSVLAEIIGPDILIVLVVLVVLFGGSQLPKLARSIGQAKHELDRGLKEGEEKNRLAADKTEKADTADKPTDA